MLEIGASTVLSFLGNYSNCTTWMSDPVKCIQGNWMLLIGAIILIIGAFVVLYLFKQIIANAIVGIIILLIIVYVLGVPIPLTPLVILVSVLGGMGGVGAILIATYFGWL